jgi:hypothetical protein
MSVIDIGGVEAIIAKTPTGKFCAVSMKTSMKQFISHLDMAVVTHFGKKQAP